jgi:regulator of protease activity HflC (stomatin/prohibitin superfamily)
MAQIKSYPMVRHLRADASAHIQYFRRGQRHLSGRGLAFWFAPDGASITEIPMDDRSMNFMVKGQSSDYQDLAVQGTISWRVKEPEKLGERVDFTIDLKTGALLAKPVDSIVGFITGLAREYADGYLKASGVRELLEKGLAPLQAAITAGFAADQTLPEMGLSIVSVRVAALTPSSELARALQVPTFESLQQKADEATFARRALAVEKERAIAENELANKVELAARRQELIAREDANARAEAEARAAAERIAATSAAEAVRLAAEAEAGRIRLVEQAAAEMERMRMAAYAGLSPEVLLALAAQEFAGKLDHIDTLNVTPDMLASLTQQLRGLMGAREVRS